MSAIDSFSSSTSDLTLAFQPELEKEELIGKIRRVLSEKLFVGARYCVAPLWTVCGSWIATVAICKNPASPGIAKAKRLALSLFSSALLLVPASLGLVLGQSAHFLAYKLSVKPFIYMRGKGGEIREFRDRITLLQCNACLTAGEVAKLVGGVALEDQQRVEGLGKLIRSLASDVLFLQEVSDIKRAYQLYEHFKEQYAHFYLHIGPTWCVLQNNSGLFVAANTPIKDAQFISFNGIPGIESMVNKGGFAFHTNFGTMCNLHLSPSDEDQSPTNAEKECRSAEKERLYNRVNGLGDIQQLKVLAGDWNEEPDLSLEGIASQNLGNTCSTEALKEFNLHNRLVNGGFRLDYAVVQNGGHIETQMMPTHDLNQPERALSDHHILIHTLYPI